MDFDVEQCACSSTRFYDEPDYCVEAENECLLCVGVSTPSDSYRGGPRHPFWFGDAGGSPKLPGVAHTSCSYKTFGLFLGTVVHQLLTALTRLGRLSCGGSIGLHCYHDEARRGLN